MKFWNDFLDSLDTPGGHLVQLALGFTVLLLAAQCGMQSMDQFRGELFGAYLYALKGTPKPPVKPS